MSQLISSLRFGPAVAEAERAEIAGWFGLDEWTDYRSRSPFRSGAWVVEILVAVPLGVIAGATGQAGSELFLALKRLWKAERTGHRGSVVAIGSDDTRLNTAPPIPDEAIEALGDVEWSSVVGAELIWDPSLRRWVERHSPR